MKPITIILFFLFLGTHVAAQTPPVLSKERMTWKNITEVVVNFEHEVDTGEIIFAGNERYLSIDFRVAEAQINLLNLEIHYENGDKQDFALNEVIKVNRNSRVIDLNGEERIMRKIVFKYKAVPHTDDKSVRLQLWGSQI